ncbi:hypothetical protein M5C72_02025 [Companilactobacillus allii]|uniref:hypothetical protein n=1 Tax=Companilactobacillus allii TaxID=1847728 RepID=UPI0012FFAEEE|nr:hypothetical protein [Companilactobacillus allii]USQ69035.1 hypothetical protein M5C72_02025 [Companilactobacillus allii]
MSVKLCKVDNSNVLTLPDNIKPMAKEYDVVQDRDGVILFSPKRENILKNEKL